MCSSQWASGSRLADYFIMLGVFLYTVSEKSLCSCYCHGRYVVRNILPAQLMWVPSTIVGNSGSIQTVSKTPPVHCVKLLPAIRTVMITVLSQEECGD
jgi:hypothetical protein